MTQKHPVSLDADNTGVTINRLELKKSNAAPDGIFHLEFEPCSSLLVLLVHVLICKQ
jgi:hypothetical protein